MKKNKEIGRRWEKGGISRGRPGLICGNKAFLVAVHTRGKPWDWGPCAFHSFTHKTRRQMYTHIHQMVHSCSPLESPQGLWDQRVKSPQAGIMGEGDVSLQRNVLIRACDHGCGHVCVSVCVVRVRDYTCTGVMVGTTRRLVCWCPRDAFYKWFAAWVCVLTEVHALGRSVARHVVLSRLGVCIEACGQVLLLLKLAVKQKGLSHCHWANDKAQFIVV